MSGWNPEVFPVIASLTPAASPQFDIFTPGETIKARLHWDPNIPDILVFDTPSYPYDYLVWNPRENTTTTMPNPVNINPPEARTNFSDLIVTDIAYEWGEFTDGQVQRLNTIIQTAYGYRVPDIRL